jgi:hypothetical protein
MLQKTSLVITNRTVEIECEGANFFMTALTCGCWYMCCRTASIEIYELQRIQTLYCKDGVIVGEIGPRDRCSSKGRFVIDAPEGGDKSTKDLFFELKDAWNIARQTMMHEEEDEEEEEDEPTLLIRGDV